MVVVSKLVAVTRAASVQVVVGAFSSQSAACDGRGLPGFFCDETEEDLGRDFHSGIGLDEHVELGCFVVVQEWYAAIEVG